VVTARAHVAKPRGATTYKNHTVEMAGKKQPFGFPRSTRQNAPKLLCSASENWWMATSYYICV